MAWLGKVVSFIYWSHYLLGEGGMGFNFPVDLTPLPPSDLIKVFLST